MSRNSYLKTQLGAKNSQAQPYSIYSLKCPRCSKINVISAIRCWNCGYDFLEGGQREKANKYSSSNLWQIVVLVLLIVVLTAIMLWVHNL